MEYDYLKQFPKRMKKVGAYATLIRNSYGKLTWKQFGFEDYDEQENFIFTVMLYIMEQSLKDEPCTIDDIGAFLDVINTTYLNKPLSYDMCRELGNFIVNVILGNEGKATYYQAYNYEEKEYERLYISFLANKIIYDENEVRRTSYYITEDGYNLLLGTLEIDQNMRLTIQEMIFKLQLEKASYDKAVDTIKNIFNQLRIQLRNMEEASRKIKKNPLAYTVADYKEQLTNNLAMITSTRDKFQQYHEHIQQKVRDLEEKDINIKKLETEEKENLENLRIIQSYLSRAIDEHQKILSSHFDLKDLYSKELENLSQMILIKRFQLRGELYEPMLKESSVLERMDYFLRPLLQKSFDKSYNLNKMLELQKPLRKKQIEEELFDTQNVEETQEEIIKRKQEHLHLYRNSLRIILQYASNENGITLDMLQHILSEEERENLLPNVEIFKEIMVELLQEQEINLTVLKKEQAERLNEELLEFQLGSMLVELTEEPCFQKLCYIKVYRTETKEKVLFTNVDSETGQKKNITCSNLWMKAGESNEL